MGKAKTNKTADTALILKGHTGSVNAVAVTPDGTRAVSASRDRSYLLAFLVWNETP
jgi:hypothetical protein